MAPIRTCELPEGALLRAYRDRGAYTDCYVTEIDRPVSQAAFVEAFYTTGVFKLERLLLSWLVGRPSTDAQAHALASGQSSSFAAWNVEAREADQLLLSDFQGRTRSWLMTLPMPGTGSTRLHFGSAVVPIPGEGSGPAKIGLGFRALLGFHRLYSRTLLHAASRRLMRSGVRQGTR
jgi:hypothetical protein